MGDCTCWVLRSLVICALFLLQGANGDNPYRFLTWKVTYGDIYPLGFKQQGILINGQFPGPQIDAATNDNLIISVYNYLKEPFLISWIEREPSWCQSNKPPLYAFVHARLSRACSKVHSSWSPQEKKKKTTEDGRQKKKRKVLVEAKADAHQRKEADNTPIEDEIEDQRSKWTASTPMTPDLFMQWKKKKMEEREAGLAAQRAERVKTDRMNGHELFLSDASLFVDNAEAYEKYQREEELEDAKDSARDKSVGAHKEKERRGGATT